MSPTSGGAGSREEGRGDAVGDLHSPKNAATPLRSPPLIPRVTLLLRQGLLPFLVPVLVTSGSFPEFGEHICVCHTGPGAILCRCRVLR